MIPVLSLLLLLFSPVLSAGPTDGSWMADTSVSEGKLVSGEGLGDAQGGAWLNGKIYLYGDLSGATPRMGVIREYDENLVPTGRVVSLTQGGKPLLTHPTGLTQHPVYGTLLGDTVNQVGKIYSIDWERALTDGTLDRAVKTVVTDDAAVNGTRPLFVEVGGKTLVATADYGDKTPKIRLYDPKRLLESGKSSAPGVLVSTIEAGPFNQNLAWDPASGTLTCVQNVEAGKGWRLDSVSLEKAMAAGSVEAPGVRVGRKTFLPHDELEGYLRTPDGREVFVTSSHHDGIVVGKSEPMTARPSEPWQMQIAPGGPLRDPDCGPPYRHFKSKL